MVCREGQAQLLLVPSLAILERCILQALQTTSAQPLNHKIENPGIPASQTNEFRDDLEDRKERRKITLT